MMTGQDWVLWCTGPRVWTGPGDGTGPGLKGPLSRLFSLLWTLGLLLPLPGGWKNDGGSFLKKKNICYNINSHSSWRRDMTEPGLWVERVKCSVITENRHFMTLCIVDGQLFSTSFYKELWEVAETSGWWQQTSDPSYPWSPPSHEQSHSAAAPGPGVGTPCWAVVVFKLSSTVSTGPRSLVAAAHLNNGQQQIIFYCCW